VIRDAILHLINEQPLLVDLPALPGGRDTVVICTNLRTTGGKLPVWVDRGGSWFVFPLAQVRFVEVPEPAGAARPVQQSVALIDQSEQPDLELDEDLLRRIRDT
jgi:hypothetical protein